MSRWCRRTVGASGSLYKHYKDIEQRRDPLVLSTCLGNRGKVIEVLSSALEPSVVSQISHRCVASPVNLLPVRRGLAHT